MTQPHPSKSAASKSVQRAESAGRGPVRLVLSILGGMLAVVLVLLAVVTGFDKTSGGEVGVVRNGGPLDNNKIRQVIQPASNLTWTGLWSSTHKYPSQQRFYTITSDDKGGDRPGVDVVRVPSSDGVDMGLEGTLYFSLSTEEASLRETFQELPSTLTETRSAVEAGRNPGRVRDFRLTATAGG